MKTIQKVLLGITLLLSLNAMAVDIKVSQLYQETEMTWTIINSEGHIEYSSEDYLDKVNCFMELAPETRYFINLDITEQASSDTALLLVSLNESGIMLINNSEENGDFSYPFYTGVKTPHLKIVGGTEAAIEDFPWQIYLQFGDYMCGGTIINERWILTAAHCTEDENGNPESIDDMLIVAGATDPFDINEGEVYSIKKFITHEDYDDVELTNDIALLELTEDIDFPNATPIGLISTEDVSNGALDAGKMVTVTGWGYTSVNPDKYLDDLQQVQLPIVTNETAKSEWGSQPNTMMFAGYRNGTKDACSGDSGGPLVVDVDGTAKLAGIVSWGSEECNTYGAYTRVSEYLDWIEKNTSGAMSGQLAITSGESNVCEDVIKNEYTAAEEGALTYEWSIEDTTAATLVIDENNSSTATLEWNTDFIGQTLLKVRCSRIADGWLEYSDWVTKRITRQANTTILSVTKEVTESGNTTIVKLSANTTGENLTYAWFKGGQRMYNKVDSTLTFNNFTQSNEGDYYVTATGTCGTVTSATITLEVNDQSTISADNSESFKLWPSTIRNEFHVNTTFNTSYTITAHTIGGNTILAERNQIGKTSINTTNWENGIYFIKISTNNITKTFKVIK